MSFILTLIASAMVFCLAFLIQMNLLDNSCNCNYASGLGMIEGYEAKINLATFTETGNNNNSINQVSIWKGNIAPYQFLKPHLKKRSVIHHFTYMPNGSEIYKHKIGSGESFLSNMVLQSPNQKAILNLTEFSFINIYLQDKCIWKLSSTVLSKYENLRPDKWLLYPQSLQMQTDGNVVLYNSNKENLWESGTGGEEFKGGELILADNGDLCLVKNGSCLWKPIVTEVKSGQILRMCQTLLSTNGVCRMIMRDTGRIEIEAGNYSEYTISWSMASTMIVVSSLSILNSHHFITMRMQFDGNLVVYNSKPESIWESGTNSTEFAGADLKLNDNGSLCIHKQKTCLWSSIFSILKSGTFLRMRQTMDSINKVCRLIFVDIGGIVVVRGDDFVVIWSLSSTMSSDINFNGKSNFVKDHPITLHMQPDGNLILYNTKHELLWESGTNLTKFAGADLKLNDDGSLCIHKQKEECLWRSIVYELKSGEFLRMRQMLWSTNKFTRLVITDSGVQVQKGDYANYTIIWNMLLTNDSNYKNHPLELQMRRDGNLVLYNSKQEMLWESGTAGDNFIGAHLRLEDDGVLCLFEFQKSNCLWISVVKKLKSGEYLRMWQSIWSTKNMTKLLLMDTGEARISLFEYDENNVNVPLWYASSNMDSNRASNNYFLNHHPTKMEMKTDGNIVLYNSIHERLWESGTDEEKFAGSELQLDDEGSLCLYRNEERVWKSNVHEIESGGKLRMGNILWSSNKKFKLTMFMDGEAMIKNLEKGYTTWYTNTRSKVASDRPKTMEMLISGNLVMYKPGQPNQIVWDSEKHGFDSVPGASLRLTDEGKICFFKSNSCSGIPWKSDQNYDSQIAFSSSAIILAIIFVIIFFLQIKKRLMFRYKRLKDVTRRNSDKVVTENAENSINCDEPNYINLLEVRIDSLKIEDTILGITNNSIVRKGFAHNLLTMSRGTTVVAVKTMIGNKQFNQQSFLEEARIILKSGRHINIINILGIVRQDPPLLILEYCAFGSLLSYLKIRRKEHVYIHVNENGDLLSFDKDAMEKQWSIYCLKERKGIDGAERMKNNMLSTKDLINFSWQIANGMEYLTARSIIHRDLAARNVLVADNKILKIADFGLAKEGTLLYTAVNTTIGLPILWMPPEAIIERIFSVKSDVWSFGIVLWEMFSLGEMPFPEFYRLNVVKMTAVLFAEWLREGHLMARPKGTPSSIYNIMESCWSLLAEKRPNFSEIRICLEAIIQAGYTPFDAITQAVYLPLVDN